MVKVHLRFANDQMTISLKTSVNNLEQIIQSGRDIKNSITNITSTYAPNNQNVLSIVSKLDKKLSQLGDQLDKTSTFTHSLPRKPRHLLTPMFASITGLASSKSLSQLRNLVTSIDLNSQRNHLKSDALLLNQHKLSLNLQHTMVTVNELMNLVHSQKTTQKIYSSLNRMVNSFSTAADEILSHYHDTLLLIQNPTFLIQMLPYEDLERVRKTISNHAELKSNFNVPAIPLFSLLRTSQLSELQL